MSQMAVGFWDAVRTDVSFGVFIINKRDPLFHPFVLFQALFSGSVWFTWLKCSNHFAPLLQCSHCLEMFLFFFFFLVRQALTTVLANRGTVSVHGCIGSHFDGLLSQLLDALHPLVLFIAMWLTSDDAGYDWDWGGCNRVYCIHVPGHDPWIFSFPVLFLFDWVGVLWPQLSKVLKPERWASSVPFPPVSLQRQVVCLLLRPVFISGESLHCFLVGVQIKSYVIATSDLWLFIHASNLLPSIPHTAPLHWYYDLIFRPSLNLVTVYLSSVYMHELY